MSIIREKTLLNLVFSKQGPLQTMATLNVIFIKTITPLNSEQYFSEIFIKNQARSGAMKEIFLDFQPRLLLIQP